MKDNQGRVRHLSSIDGYQEHSRSHLAGDMRERPQDDARLMSLPRELREQIYKLVWVCDREEGGPRDLSCAGLDFRFLLACRQIYREAKEIYNQAQYDRYAESMYVLTEENHLIFVPRYESEEEL